MAAKKKRARTAETSVPTLKMERFIDEYLVDGNATQAAIRAGYSRATAYSAGPRLLKNVGVAARLAEKQAERAARVQITQDEVLRQLKWQLNFNAKRLFDPETGRALAPHLLPDDIASVLVGMDSEELFASDGDGPVPIGETKKFKFPDKAKHIELAMKHLGMITEKKDVNVKGTLSFEDAVLASMKPPPAPKPVVAPEPKPEGAE